MQVKLSKSLTILLLMAHSILFAQTSKTGHIYDAKTNEPLPFAIVKFGNGQRGTVADLDGKFQIPADINPHDSVEVSYLGYLPAVFPVPKNDTGIYLQPFGNSLNEIVIKPDYDKVNRIINKAIANKYMNDPDKYDWYQCHVYYKMVVNASLPDSTLKRLKKEKENINDFLEKQHLLMSETYSIRTWEKPQRLQEDVLASRFSGLRKSMFTSLVTDVLPFHAYTDYINLNGKDYHNPISRGFEQYYKFSLDNELMEGTDTVWVLNFRPKGNKSNYLSGTVYINSDGYAISQIRAMAEDTILQRTVRIEQQYEQVPVSTSESRWFPRHLNYIIDWHWKSRKKSFTFHMKGTSRIDSVTFTKHENFKFDKTHTVRLAPHADEVNDSTWARITPEPLNEKEKRTYKVIDSLGEKTHMDQTVSYFSKLPEGKLPIGIFDFDLLRLVSANYYENFRLSMGVQTNEHLVKWLSVGGWGGYGFGDAHWKYGAFTELYADRYHEFVFKAGYTNDISDPGRIHLNPDLDKNYLSSYLLQRVDQVKAFTVSVKKKLGYLSLQLSATQEEIMPKYHYALQYEGGSSSTYNASEASLNFRYAYAERTAPFFSHYNSLGSKYPVWYGKITIGVLESGDRQTPYTQAISAVLWHKHINRIGFEHVLLEGGKSWSNGSLPLSKLFAGNGFNYNSGSAIPESIYTFGGMMTIFPYQYYTDQFINFIYRHDFDWKLYKIAVPNSYLSSAPNICLQYNILYGTLAHPEAQQYVAFSVPDNAYHEAGLILNNLIRYKYLNLYYFTINIGYFYHITNTFDAGKNGRAVFSIGFDF